MYLSSTLLCYKPYSPQALNTRHNRKPLSSLETVTPLDPKFNFPPTIKTPKLSSLPGPRRRCRWEMGGSNLRSQSSEHLTGRLGGLRASQEEDFSRRGLGYIEGSCLWGFPEEEDVYEGVIKGASERVYEVFFYKVFCRVQTKGGLYGSVKI